MYVPAVCQECMVSLTSVTLHPDCEHYSAGHRQVADKGAFAQQVLDNTLKMYFDK